MQETRKRLRRREGRRGRLTTALRDAEEQPGRDETAKGVDRAHECHNNRPALGRSVKVNDRREIGGEEARLTTVQRPSQREGRRNFFMMRLAGTAHGKSGRVSGRSSRQPIGLRTFAEAVGDEEARESGLRKSEDQRQVEGQRRVAAHVVLLTRKLQVLLETLKAGVSCRMAEEAQVGESMSAAFSNRPSRLRSRCAPVVALPLLSRRTHRCFPCTRREVEPSANFPD